MGALCHGPSWLLSLRRWLRGLFSLRRCLSWLFSLGSRLSRLFGLRSRLSWLFDLQALAEWVVGSKGLAEAVGCCAVGTFFRVSLESPIACLIRLYLNTPTFAGLFLDFSGSSGLSLCTCQVPGSAPPPALSFIPSNGLLGRVYAELVREKGGSRYPDRENRKQREHEKDRCPGKVAISMTGCHKKVRLCRSR